MLSLPLRLACQEGLAARAFFQVAGPVFLGPSLEEIFWEAFCRSRLPVGRGLAAVRGLGPGFRERFRTNRLSGGPVGLTQRDHGASRFGHPCILSAIHHAPYSTLNIRWKLGGVGVEGGFPSLAFRQQSDCLAQQGQ